MSTAQAEPVTVDFRDCDPDRVMQAWKAPLGWYVQLVPFELAYEVQEVAEAVVRGGVTTLQHAGRGARVLQILTGAPGLAVRLHPAEPCAEYRPWRSDGSGLPEEDGPVVRVRRDSGSGELCAALVLGAVIAERRGMPAPPELLAASVRLLAGGYAEVSG